MPTVAELSYGYVGDNKNEFVKRVSNKAKKAAIQIINLLEKKPNSPAINVIRYQLIKSATSTSANYRAVRVSRSNKEFYAKICVVVEECAETIQWLEVLIEADVNVDKAGLKEILPEWIELMRIFSSAKHTMRTKLH
ncbi:MAG: four helix bundle protein [Bacteroidota bacterium]